MNTTTTSSHPSATVALMSQQALVSRSWNGTPISRRTSDGYVNATAMCKANGKRWKDYRESDRCQHYLDALESVAGISVHALVESRSGGAGGGGTWVHPQVAVDLARWISAPFAVWMDGWFLESIGVAQSATAEPLQQRIAAASRPRGLRQDPVWKSSYYLPALIAQRWIGDPEANEIIRGFAHHLLLSCGPLPAIAAVDEAALSWNRAMKARTGQQVWW